MSLRRVDNLRDDKFSHGDAEDYRILLKNILKYYEIRPLRDHPAEGRVCYFRHDVDTSINGALRMAQIEAETGISSTYYILPTATYFQRSAGKMGEIQELGHKIGLHHNFIKPFHRKRGQANAQSLFLSQLHKLRRLGVDVKTVSTHGDPLCRKYEISNYQMFLECPSQLERLGVFPMKLSLKEHGLREAHFLERDCYVTDSGGGWQYTFEQYVDEWNGRFLRTTQIIDLIRNLGEQEKTDKLLLLTHPCWWRFYESELD